MFDNSQGSMPRVPKSKSKKRIIDQAVQRIERRGGPRENAGRKPGTRTQIKRMIGIREITEDIIQQGKVPLRVMIKNMVHYDEMAEKFTEQMEEAMADFRAQFSEEGFIKVLEIMNQMGDARMKAGHFAQMAAPYLHPRLSAIQHTIERKKAVDLPDGATPEQYQESFRQLRSQDYIPPIIEQDDVEVVTEDAD